MKEAWPTSLQVEVGQADGYPCVRLLGEGEGEGAQLLQRALCALIEEGHHRIILDTRDLRFLDLRCFESLEAVVRRLDEEGGLLVVVDQCSPVERTLKLLSLETLAYCVPTVSQATAYLDWHE